MSTLVERLRKQCIWQRAKGTDRDNGYPYHKHVPDCEICQSADEIERLEPFERIALMSGQNIGLRLMNAEAEIESLEQDKADLKEFCTWLTGCGYNFCQHEYFIQQRDKLLKEENGKT